MQFGTRRDDYLVLDVPAAGYKKDWQIIDRRYTIYESFLQEMLRHVNSREKALQLLHKSNVEAVEIGSILHNWENIKKDRRIRLENAFSRRMEQDKSVADLLKGQYKFYRFGESEFFLSQQLVHLEELVSVKPYLEVFQELIIHSNTERLHLLEEFSDARDESMKEDVEHLHDLLSSHIDAVERFPDLYRRIHAMTGDRTVIMTRLQNAIESDLLDSSEVAVLEAMIEETLSHMNSPLNRIDERIRFLESEAVASEKKGEMEKLLDMQLRIAELTLYKL